jgi:hypothetical protein
MARWVRKRRACRVRKRVWHVQAFADRGRQVIGRSESALDHWLIHACATAERLGGKASSTRRTTVQILRESVSPRGMSAALAMATNAELHADAGARSFTL